MTDDRSDALKEWMKSIEEMQEKGYKEELEEYQPIFQVYEEFSQILTRIRRDFDGVKKGKSQFSILTNDDYGDDEKKTFIIVNPTNNIDISDERYNQISNALIRIRVAAEYPNKVHNGMMQQYRRTQVKFEIEPKMTKSLEKPLKSLYKELAISLIDNKWLDLRDDYPGADALWEFAKDIDRRIIQENEKHTLI